MGGQLRSLIAKQHGVVTRAQLLNAGLTARMVEVRRRTGRLHPVHRGVYAAGRPGLDDRGLWMAAVLAAGPDAVLSHRSAAALWELRHWGSRLVEITSSHGVARPRVIAHESHVPTPERAVVDGIPVTTVRRTLIDLAEVVTREELERALHQAYRLRLFRGEVSGPPGRNGTARLRALLSDHPDGADRTRSWLEVTMLRLCRGHGLPLPRVNVMLEGRERDLHWPDENLVVEVDGRDEHFTPVAFEVDRERDTELMEAGYAVRRFTYRQVTERPAWVAGRIAAALEP
jgi:very-short-patch-repair endonuclease